MPVRTAEVLEPNEVKPGLTLPERNLFEALSFNTYNKVFNLAYRLSGNRSDAEEITQDAFVRAYRSFSDYKADKPFENWIMKITSRLFIDLLRTRRRRVTTVSFDTPMAVEGSEGVYFDMPDHKSNPENMLIRDMFEEDLQLAVSSLNEEQSLLVEMADLQKVPYRDIAQKIGKPIGTVRSKLHRTHRFLQNSLETTERLKTRGIHSQPEQGSRMNNRVISGSLTRSGSPHRAHSKHSALAMAVDSVGDKK